MITFLASRSIPTALIFSLVFASFAVVALIEEVPV